VRALVQVRSAERIDDGRLEVAFHVPTASAGQPFGYGTFVFYGPKAAVDLLEREYAIGSEHELALDLRAAAPPPVSADSPRRMRWLGGQG
jgi:hypothetical protein